MVQVRELIKGNTDTLLLCLANQQPMYGYQIIKEMDKRSKGYFRFKEGTLYPALHRLEQQGWLQGKWEKTPGGQKRRYYHITEKGRRVLDRKIAEWDGFYRAVNLTMQPATP